MHVVVCFLLPIVQHESRATIRSVLGGKAGGNVVDVVAKADGGVVLLECWVIPPAWMLALVAKVLSRSGCL